MKDILVKYGTFLIVPFVIIGIAFTLCNIRVREKCPVTLVCLSDSVGIVYVPNSADIQIAKGKTLVVETAQYAHIECRVVNVAEEPANKRIQVLLAPVKNQERSTFFNAYIVTKEVPMSDLVLQKILKM